MTTARASAPAVELRQITKSYGDFLANDGVDLEVAAGEIHALLGENGAGKSTLMGVLFGLIQPDSGEILLDGAAREFKNTRAAIDAGLGMVHQSFKLFPSLSVAENVVFAAEPTRRGRLDTARAIREVGELSERFGLDVSPSARVGALPVGLRQQVEILKALYRRANVLILDEPTAVLTPRERDGLFTMLDGLRAEGKAVILVTHKLNEVMAISDRLTVLRGGKTVVSRTTAQTSPTELASDMTGRSIDLDRRFDSASPGEVVLRTDDLSLTEGGVRTLDQVSLQVRAGEIVGVAGVSGNGQAELVRAIAGLVEPTAGTVVLGADDLTSAGVAERRRKGLAYVPEDRHETGTAPGSSIGDNLIFGEHRNPAYVSPWRTLRSAPIAGRVADLVSRFGIKTGDASAPTTTLSGGNMQKVVLARELSSQAQALVVEQPTRGVDIGAIEYIHELLSQRRADGMAILLVSSELPEIFALADRIVVMFEGRIIGELDRAEADEESVGLLMAGVA